MPRRMQPSGVVAPRLLLVALLLIGELAIRDGSGVRCKRMIYVNKNASLAFKTCWANRVGSQAVARSMGVCSNAHTVAETKALDR